MKIAVWFQNRWKHHSIQLLVIGQYGTTHSMITVCLHCTIPFCVINVKDGENCIMNRVTRIAQRSSSIPPRLCSLREEIISKGECLKWTIFIIYLWILINISKMNQWWWSDFSSRWRRRWRSTTASWRRSRRRAPASSRSPRRTPEFRATVHSKIR